MPCDDPGRVVDGQRGTTQLAERFPQYRHLAAGRVGVWDPEAGVVRSETAIITAVAAARVAGAEIYTDTPVSAIDVLDGGVVIRTAPDRSPSG